MKKLLCEFLLIGSVCAAVAASPPPPPPAVDASYAWRMAEQAVEIVPRHAGSPGALRSIQWMERELKQYSQFRVRIEEFSEETPAGETVFRNLVAEIAGSSPQFVLIGAHYDTKYVPAEAGFRFQGANDGASGVAVLLAMIRAVDAQKTPPPLGIRFVLFDGEECRESYSRHDGLHGSRREAQSLEKSGRLRDCRAMLLADMVGDRELRITFPANSDAKLKSLAREEADKLGVGHLVSGNTGWILDDDLPFQVLKIPTLNFIDFDYGPGNSWWHTPEDTLDKLSPRSLKTVADLMLALVWRLGDEPRD